MTIPDLPDLDPDVDLLLDRVIDVSVDEVWAAWTEPEQVKQWFTPAPFETSECEIDLRPGGVFRTVMRSPEGVEHETAACYLHIEPPRRLVWTTILGPGFRPIDEPELPLTAIITLESVPDGTRYAAMVMHSNPVDAAQHSERGFHAGWSTALDQLVGMIHRRTSDPSTQ